LLAGYRQTAPLDVAAFAELLYRVSNMVEDIPEITELDLNPTFVRQHGAVAADVRIRLTGSEDTAAAGGWYPRYP
jgi:acyl-CoA synthetase (NDP forming)